MGQCSPMSELSQLFIFWISTVIIVYSWYYQKWAKSISLVHILLELGSHWFLPDFFYIKKWSWIFDLNLISLYLCFPLTPSYIKVTIFNIIQQHLTFSISQIQTIRCIVRGTEQDFTKVWKKVWNINLTLNV